MRLVRKNPQNGGPESGTKTDVVSRGASVKIVVVAINSMYLSTYYRNTKNKRTVPIIVNTIIVLVGTPRTLQGRQLRCVRSKT